ncbi:MAG: penicillin-binding protein 2 [Tannerella sp.]|jgi:penicillin-binding protein 2|nr:penicillin-binding protein 2 [Tannerella sp.]
MTDRSNYQNGNRRYVFIAAVVCVILVFTIRLIDLQLVNSAYKDWADSNAFLKKTLYPARGVIYDRNDKLLVYNQPAYDVMLIMKETQPFDTVDFCNTLGIAQEFFNKRIRDIRNRELNPGYSQYLPQVFMTQLSTGEYGMLQEKLYKFPGFYLQNRPVREYGYPNAALVLGNIGEVSKRHMENDSYYARSDYIGLEGVERSYEKTLRGKKGKEVLLRDARGRIKGRYEGGVHDETPVSGKNLKLSIDIELQAYAEKLMRNKMGGVVMIEPSTGEVLCLVSSPTYDPNLLVGGRQLGKNYTQLERDPLKPLFNRAIKGRYPPGSTYKPAQGLVFLQEGVITPQKLYTCAYGYPYHGGKPACHGHASPLGLNAALATSCNSYFCWGLHDMLDSRKRYPTVQEAFEIWKGYMVSMGFGYTLGIDLPGESRGFIPNSKVYDRFYKGRWNSSSIISIAIGQGEIDATPLQICNLAATIANRGQYIVPHVVREIEDTPLDTAYTRPRRTLVEAEHYDAIVEGMRSAVLYGTCTGLYMPGIEVCGKTGTAQSTSGIDNSACIAFAPCRQPKIAIAVYVERGGYGKTNAIPIARLMLEKFFHGEVGESLRFLEADIMNRVVL